VCVPYLGEARFSHSNVMSKIPKTVSEYLATVGSKDEHKSGKATTHGTATAARKNGKLSGKPSKKKVQVK
jgi:hypothetical protein